MTIYQAGSFRKRQRQILRGVVLVSLLGLTGTVSAVQVRAQADEYQVKAAFIFNFAKFVEWPGDAFSDGGPLVVAVVGDDPFGGALDRINGSMANGRRLRIKRLRMGDNLRACHILYIAQSEARNVGKILDNVRGTSVLTIGETAQFNQSGGMIRFVIQNQKVRFEINANAASQVRLRISSKLLALSKGGN
jgi:hypothetical protein